MEIFVDSWSVHEGGTEGVFCNAVSDKNFRALSLGLDQETGLLGKRQLGVFVGT